MAAETLITGADGYLGLRIAQQYLESTEERVVLWVRAADTRESRDKAELLALILARFPGRARLCFGDLTRPDPFTGIDPRSVRSIIHSAAVTRFNVDAETADRVNVAGTRKLLDFAARCPDLERLALLSTVYASGLTAGKIPESPLTSRPEFANHYERSKWESEAVLANDCGGLPWSIFRVATVIADDDSGAVTQQNAFHNTLKLLFYGLLSLIPGRSDTPVYLVTGEFVVDSVVELMQRSGSEIEGVFHLAPRREESLTLGQLIDVAFAVFERVEDFRSRRILKPVFADEEAFRLLVDGMRAFGGGVMNQALSSVAPFARQLFVNKEIENRRLAGALAQYSVPAPLELAERVCSHLIRTRWGREVIHAAG